MEERPLSYLIDSLLPEYVKTDYPTYVEFVKTYLQALESESGPFKVLNEITKYIDVAIAPEEKIPDFVYQYLHSFPSDFLEDVNVREFITNSKTFYSFKGNEASIRFIFNLIKGSIDFYYPSSEIFETNASLLSGNPSGLTKQPTHKLHDNTYYAYYVYELISDLDFTIYEEIVRDMTHPAGMKMYFKKLTFMGADGMFFDADINLTNNILYDEKILDFTHSIEPNYSPIIRKHFSVVSPIGPDISSYFAHTIDEFLYYGDFPFEVNYTLQNNNITFDGGDNSINTSEGTDFSVLTSGTEITVSGAGEAGNNDTFGIIGAVTSAKIFVDGTLTTEGGGGGPVQPDFRMWYSGRDSSSGDYSIISTDSDDGIVWDNFQMVLPEGAEGTYDLGGSLYPCVIQESPTSYKMWYEGRRIAVIYATSVDGLTWTNHQPVILVGDEGTYDSGRVEYPFVLQESPTSYKMWYTGDSDFERIIYATSTDGINWSNHQMVINVGDEGIYDNWNVWGACVVKESGHPYKMWYSGTGDDGARRIFYAESEDGISWSNHQMVMDIIGEEPYGPEEYYHLERPWVIQDSPTLYKIWFQATFASGRRSMYATSTDGINWGTAVTAFQHSNAEGTYDSQYLYSGSVVEAELVNDYKMYVTNHSGESSTILRTTSTDGFIWDEGSTVISSGDEGTYDTSYVKEPTIIKNSDSDFQLWYSGWNGAPWFLYATSTDGITWSNHQMVIELGAEGTYDNINIYKPYVFKESPTSYKIWYMAYNPGNNVIIYATSTDGINWNNHQVVLSTGDEGTHDIDGLNGPSVIIESPTSYKIWYEGQVDGGPGGIIYATSVDGINWNNHQRVIAPNIEGTYDITTVSSPDVIKESPTSYKMWYGGYYNALTVVMYADSTDGINWSNHQMVKRGDPSYVSLSSPSVYKDSEEVVGGGIITISEVDK